MDIEVEVKATAHITLDESEVRHINEMFHEYMELRRALPSGTEQLGTEKHLIVQDFKDIGSQMRSGSY